MAGFEVIADALSRCKDLEPATIRDAILATDIDSLYGHLTFDENQVAAVPIPCGQWIEGEKWEIEKIITGTYELEGVETVQPIYMPGSEG